MRALGIDFGERRIGVAISDPEGSYALPKTVLERRSDRQAIDELAALARAESIELLVVGEPRRPADGAATAQGERARRFGRRLAAAAGLPVEFVDEALTSHAAAERIATAGGRGRRPPMLDAVAAQLLLQEALDRRRAETR
jgi:putative Holliday junction resolvase